MSGREEAVKDCQDVASDRTVPSVDECCLEADEESIRGIVKALDDHFDEWAGRLTAGERAALREYVAWGYEDINGLLRGTIDEETMSEAALDRAYITRRDLRSALSKGELPMDVMVFRGVKDFDATLDALTAGDQAAGMKDKAFLSTSVDPERAMGKATGPRRGLFCIQVRSGQSAAWMAAPALGLPHRHELEVLLPEETKMMKVALCENATMPIMRVEVIA